MNVLLLANNWVGWKVAEWFSETGVNIAGLVTHATKKQKYTTEIINESGLSSEKIFDGSMLGEADVMEAIKLLQPDIVVSAFFDYILSKQFIELFPQGCINIHPSYLPYGRGSYPNVFSIIEKEPAGATIHYIDEGIDTGDIIERKEVTVEISDTGETLYRKLEQECVELFKKTWPAIEEGKAKRIPQSQLGKGSLHKYKDADAIDHIHLDKHYQAMQIIDILRARTFPPHKGAYILDEEGNKIYLRLQILSEDEL